MRHALDICILAIVAGSQALIWMRLAPVIRQRWLRSLLLCGALWVFGGVALGMAHSRVKPPAWVRAYIVGGAYAAALGSTGAIMAYEIFRRASRAVPEHVPGRRRLLEAGAVAAVAAPFALTGFGTFIERTRFRVREIDVPVRGLDPSLHGKRLLQLSDIHLSPFLSEDEFARVIDASNEVGADLSLITGDLISFAGDPLDACLRQIARLRTPAGVLGCMGNHERYSDAEDYTLREGARLGIRFLRAAQTEIDFGGARINFAGVDYQSVHDRENYLKGTERLLRPGMPNILLSHNPDVFPVAAAKGFDLTVAGHTHGGQVTVEILEQTLNVARFATPFVSGYYQESGRSLYVTRGIGTIGLPARIGAPPEIAVLRIVSG